MNSADQADCDFELTEEQLSQLIQAVQDADEGKFASPEAVQAVRQRYLG